MSWLQEAYSKLQNKFPGVEASSELTNSLEKYYDERLDEAEEMIGYNPYVESPNVVYDDMGGRPAPLNPNQFPTWEEIDAIRHYYGPQLVSEELGGGPLGALASVIYPAIHETEGLFAGDGAAQIIPDTKNNLISAYDEVMGKDKYPAKGLLGRLKGQMPPGEFEVFAKHALSRTTVPPKYQE